MSTPPNPTANRRVRLWSRLLFFDPEQPHIRLDLVTTRGWAAFLDDSLFHQGEPFSLVVAYPGPDLGYLVLARFERWAGDGIELCLDVTCTASTARVRMSDGRSTIVLDLVTSSAGLPIRGWGV